MNTYNKIKNKKTKLAVVGLDYVVFSLAVEFRKVVNIIGIDFAKKRKSDFEKHHVEYGWKKVYSHAF